MRPSNDQYFLGIADAVSKRATCGKRQVGAVVVDKDYQILATGYNSVPQGLPHCPSELECPGMSDGACITRHAEDVALMKCNDIYRIDTIYITLQPCEKCIRRLLDTSCKTIIFKNPLDTYNALTIWSEAGRNWRQIP